MQKGSIRISGKWWYLKIRQNITEGGKLVKNAETYHKLLPVAEYPRSSDGSAPLPVQQMANDIALNVNLKKTNVHAQPIAIDSFRSFLESYLCGLDAGNLGNQGKPVRKITARSYRRDFRVIEKFLPDMPLRSVRTPHINTLFEKLRVDDGDDVRATSAYRNIRNFLSGAFRDAVGRGVAEYNPVRDSKVLAGNDADTHAYTLREVRQLLNIIRQGDGWQHTMRAAFMVAFFTGLRMEEVKGLKWEDYDKTAGLLHVRRTVVHHQIVEGTKTRASEAAMPVVKIVAKELAEHLKRNSGEGYIFHKIGSVHAPIIFEQLILDYVHPACRKAGIEFYGMHAFRRGLDSWMREEGVEDSLRSAVLRHAPRNVADKHYGRRPLERVRMTLEKFETVYNRAK